MGRIALEITCFDVYKTQQEEHDGEGRGQGTHDNKMGGCTGVDKWSAKLYRHNLGCNESDLFSENTKNAAVFQGSP